MTDELGKILEAIDSQVRASSVRAHEEVLKQVAKIKSLTLGGVTIPTEALVPRDLLETDKIEMEFDVFLRDNGASLSRGYRLCDGGTKAHVKMKWKAVPAPEATALIRTKCETTIAEIPLKPSTPKGDDNG